MLAIAPADIQEIDHVLAGEGSDDGSGFLFPQTAFTRACAHAHAHGIIRSYLGTHRQHDFAQKPHSIFQRSSITVSARIRQRRKKLHYQIAMRGVDLDPVDPALPASPRGSGRSLSHMVLRTSTKRSEGTRLNSSH